MFQLRDYQNEAVRSIWDYYIAGNTGNPVVAMPTATGKSLVIAELIRTVLMTYTDQRILVLTHVKELIEQNFDKMSRLWPTAPIGIFSAGLGRRDYKQSVIFGGIASVAKRAKLFMKTNLVLIDECHLVSDDDTTMYRKLIDQLLEFNPELKVIGFSATPFRLGLGMITDGGLFTDVCCDMTGPEAFRRFIAAGYLCPLIPKRTQTKMDLTGLHLRGGEFIDAELGERFGRDAALTRAALEETWHQAQGRRKWLIFATSIEHTGMIVDMLRHMGVAAEAVHSQMTTAERDRNIAAFRSGAIRALVNKNILTTGFDDPEIDCIVMLRPTQSPGLWVQMLGRATRPAPDKPNALVLDFAGNTAALGPIDDPRLPTRKGPGVGEAPSKVCEVCSTYNHASVRRCICCGAEFHMEPKYRGTASEIALLSTDMPKVQVYPVTAYYATRHQKRGGGTDSLKITYESGKKKFHQWLCLDHSGGARRLAERSWRSLAPPGSPLPSTVAQGLDWFPYLPRVQKIKVITNSDYPEVIGHEF